MRTPATDLLGIDVPIFAFSHCRDVVAAVTNAGGCGVLGAVAHSPEQLDIDLTWIEEEVKGRPYGVDLLVPERFAGADEGGLDRAALRDLIPDEHRAWLDEMLDRHGVPPLPEGDGRTMGSAIGGMRIDPKSMAPLLDVLFSHETKLVASALGPPPAYFLERAHGAGIPVAALAGSVDHARRHAEAGADLIVAQGTEAGGHTGQIATMVLVPEVVDAVAPVPVLAAGGIGSGRQLAAGMALGAAGAWCGSVWLTTEEAETPQAVKQKYLAAGLGDTVRSRSITGKPARMLRTAWTDEWESPESPGPLPMPLQPMLTGQALARIHRVAGKEGSGAQELATYFVGQVVGSMNTKEKKARYSRAMEHVDVVVIGAGLSGIGAACRIRSDVRWASLAVLEARDGIGGTWDLFRYPGIRSDSDMYTLGYSFRPWDDERAIADGESIRRYISDTADEFGVTEHIRFGHRVVSAAWSSEEARWRLQVERAG